MTEQGKSSQTDRQTDRPWRAPMVSVVVPVYNVEPYLAECVESIYAQTFRDYELLLIDDASTDGSGRLADELAAKDVRARVIHLVKNGGLGPARNRGVRESIGKYIAFVDSDDWVKRDYLSDLVVAAEKYQADVVCMGDERYFPQEDGSWRVEPHWKPTTQDAILTPDKKGRVEVVLAGQLSNIACGKLISRELFAGTGLRFEPILSEDTLFAFELLYQAGTYVLIPSVGYCYRQTQTSILHQKTMHKSRKAMESVLHALACLDRDLERMPELLEDARLCHRVRQWFAGVYLLWLWLRVSEGLDGDAVLAEEEQVFREKAPEQATLLRFLLEAWIQQFASPSK